MTRILLVCVFAIATLFTLTGCDRAKSNVFVISTDDCGAHWKIIPQGEVVPKHMIVCGYNMAIPNWPMAGDASFKTQFKGKVLSKAKLSYTYTITDPIAFIGEARYLGKMTNRDLEISADDIGNTYEMAENIIIDKQLREITTEITREMDIVDANPAEIEEAISKSITEVLLKKGITFSELALVIENDEQTRLAIDAATAVRIYEAAGIADTGQRVMTARAGAPNITINVQQQATDESK